MEKPDSPTYCEIDLSAFSNNLKEIRRLIPDHTKIMAVVKANAYGHGSVTIAKEAQSAGAEFLAVARLNEAMLLRNGGITLPILLFDDSAMHSAEIYIDQNIRPSVSSMEEAILFSKSATQYGKPIKIHIKIDTGMGRLGFLSDELSHKEPGTLARTIAEISNLPNIKIEGIYSHFATSDEKDKKYANTQLAIFKKLIAQLNELLSYKPLYHMANSGAIIDIPESHLDMVRPGISIYGIYPSQDVCKDKIDLHPVMSIKSKIVHLKKVKPNFKISYGCTFTTKRDSIIATVPVGYADGFPRSLSSKGEMIVRGQRAPVIGRVCMDLTMIDVTDIEGVSLYDEVVVMGRQDSEEITADEIASKCNTISYEILTSISPRVTRIFLKKS
ncbi:MAG TPA: alanine racemase [Spirochaetota bacterium]|nr:alanine racemase [Spirochaetota bacterium]HPP96090.1 alanine racemase [Spirochaetota bacterium]